MEWENFLGGEGQKEFAPEEMGDYHTLARRTMEIILPEGHSIPPEGCIIPPEGRRRP